MAYGRETIWTFETKNFRVSMFAEPEEMDPADSFEFGDDIEAVRNGDVAWFCAHVSVTHKPTGTMLGDDYLGGCAYEDIRRDFVEAHWRNETRNTLASKADGVVYCDYFPDMIRQAIAQARTQAQSFKTSPIRPPRRSSPNWSAKACSLGSTAASSATSRSPGPTGGR